MAKTFSRPRWRKTRCHPALIEMFERAYGVELAQAWGMTQALGRQPMTNRSTGSRGLLAIHARMWAQALPTIKHCPERRYRDDQFLSAPPPSLPRPTPAPERRRRPSPPATRRCHRCSPDKMPRTRSQSSLNKAARSTAGRCWTTYAAHSPQWDAPVEMACVQQAAMPATARIHKLMRRERCNGAIPPGTPMSPDKQRRRTAP
jgi:hypothetical protein